MGGAYEIPKEEFSEEFIQTWQVAKAHLDSYRTHGLQWLRNHLCPPVVEHLSFRLGNQLFFVFLANAGAGADYIYRRRLFLETAKQANAHPCLMVMRKGMGAREPASEGWGLSQAHPAKSGKRAAPVDPLTLVTDELIEMTDWEVHDFAIQAVRQNLASEGKKVLSSQSNLGIDPQIFFEDEGAIYWIMVRGVRYPEMEASIPSNIREVAEGLMNQAAGGYFASVAAANNDDPFDPAAKENGNFLPLYRGHALRAKLQDLAPIY